MIPDFLSQTGDARVTLNLKDFPNQSNKSKDTIMMDNCGQWGKSQVNSS